MAVLACSVAGAETFSIEKVADSDTVIPGKSFACGSVINSRLDAGEVLFFSWVSIGGYEAMHVWSNGVFKTVIDSDTPIPGGADNFNNFGGEMSISQGEVAFRGGYYYGSSDNWFALYKWSGGGLVEIVGPDDGLFTYRNPWINKGQVVFNGATGTSHGNTKYATYL